MTSSTQTFSGSKKHPWKDAEFKDMGLARIAYLSPDHHDHSPALRSELITFDSHVKPHKNPLPSFIPTSCPASGVQVRMFMLTEMDGSNHRSSDVGMNKRSNKSYNVGPNFLSVCYTCNKRLEHEKDIYIYRGEMAFCSQACRGEVMTLDGLQISGLDDDHATTLT